MRAAIYARVSTTDQKSEMQLAELREYVSRRAWELAAEYVDTGWSGSKASRPELDRLMRDTGQRKADVILCWKLDRFGRSLLHCMNALQELQAHGVRFIATSQGIDTDESNNTAFCSILFQKLIWLAGVCRDSEWNASSAISGIRSP